MFFPSGFYTLLWERTATEKHGEDADTLQGLTNETWGIRTSNQVNLLGKGNSWPNEEVIHLDEPTCLASRLGSENLHPTMPTKRRGTEGKRRAFRSQRDRSAD